MHAYVCARNLFELSGENHTLGMRAVVRRVVKLLHDGYHVVVDDENMSLQKTRASYCSNVQEKCRGIALRFVCHSLKPIGEPIMYMYVYMCVYVWWGMCVYVWWGMVGNKGQCSHSSKSFL